MFKISPLILSNALSIAAMMAFIVIVGPVIRLLEMQEWHAGALVAIAGLVWLLTSRAWGVASDRRGRKPILLVGMFGFTVGYLILAIFVDYALSATALSAFIVLIVLAMIRGVIGGFFAAIPAASNALIADHYPPNERASKMALLGAGNALGMIFGPLLAGLLVSMSLAMPMYFATVLPLIAMLILWKGLPTETVKEAAPVAPVKFSDPRLRLPIFAAITAISCVITAQVAIGFFAIDVLAQDPEAAARVTGYAMTAVGVTLVLVQGVMAKLPKVAPKTWLMVGALIAAVSFASVIWISQPIHLVLAYAGAAVGLGWVFPSMQAMAANSVTAEEQGVAAGTLGAAQGIGMVIAPLVATGVYVIAPSTPYLLSALMLVVLSVLAWRHHRPAVEEPDDQALSTTS